jgi:hypothetical protein
MKTIPTTTFTQPELADISLAAAMRASVYATALRNAHEGDCARAEALDGMRECYEMLAAKVQAAMTHRPTYGFDEYELHFAIEAVKAPHRAKRRSFDRKTFQRLDTLLRKLQQLHASLLPADPWDADDAIWAAGFGFVEKYGHPVRRTA